MSQEIEQLEQQTKRYKRNLYIIILLDLVSYGILKLIQYFYLTGPMMDEQILTNTDIPLIVRGLIIIIGLWIFSSSIFFYIILYKRRKLIEEINRLKTPTNMVRK